MSVVFVQFTPYVIVVSNLSFIYLKLYIEFIDINCWQHWSNLSASAAALFDTVLIARHIPHFVTGNDYEHNQTIPSSVTSYDVFLLGDNLSLSSSAFSDCWSCMESQNLEGTNDYRMLNVCGEDLLSDVGSVSSTELSSLLDDSDEWPFVHVCNNRSLTSQWLPVTENFVSELKPRGPVSHGLIFVDHWSTLPVMPAERVKPDGIVNDSLAINSMVAVSSCKVPVKRTEVTMNLSAIKPSVYSIEETETIQNVTVDAYKADKVKTDDGITYVTLKASQTDHETSAVSHSTSMHSLSRAEDCICRHLEICRREHVSRKSVSCDNVADLTVTGSSLRLAGQGNVDHRVTGNSLHNLGCTEWHRARSYTRESDQRRSVKDMSVASRSLSTSGRPVVMGDASGRHYCDGWLFDAADSLTYLDLHGSSICHHSHRNQAQKSVSFENLAPSCSRIARTLKSEQKLELVPTLWMPPTCKTSVFWSTVLACQSPPTSKIYYTDNAFSTEDTTTMVTCEVTAADMSNSELAVESQDSSVMSLAKSSDGIINPVHAPASMLIRMKDNECLEKPPGVCGVIAVSLNDSEITNSNVASHSGMPANSSKVKVGDLTSNRSELAITLHSVTSLDADDTAASIVMQSDRSVNTSEVVRAMLRGGTLCISDTRITKPDDDAEAARKSSAADQLSNDDNESLGVTVDSRCDAAADSSLGAEMACNDVGIMDPSVPAVSLLDNCSNLNTEISASVSVSDSDARLVVIVTNLFDLHVDTSIDKADMEPESDLTALDQVVEPFDRMSSDNSHKPALNTRIGKSTDQTVDMVASEDDVQVVSDSDITSSQECLPSVNVSAQGIQGLANNDMSCISGSTLDIMLPSSDPLSSLANSVSIPPTDEHTDHSRADQHSVSQVNCKLCSGIVCMCATAALAY